ncbi:LOW QUALITY PROTEIN: Zinc finger MYM-type protein 1, partial [Galemys pyrenaicus]
MCPAKIIGRRLYWITVEADFNKMHGSVYMGAADTSERFNVVATTFTEDEPRALYTHCHAHLGDLMVCRDMKELRSDLSPVNSLYDTIHASLKSWQIFKTFVSRVKASHTGSSGVVENMGEQNFMVYHLKEVIYISKPFGTEQINYAKNIVPNGF